jgi:hypothetical protein
MTRPVHWAAAVAAAWLLCALPAEARAQCTASCACTTRSCECSTVGGKGSGCETDGERCIVLRCDAIFPTRYIVAPNGTLFRTAASGNPDSMEGADAPGAEPSRWQTVAPGHAVRRNCLGIVLEEWFDPAAARAVREQSRLIVI